MSVVSKSMTSLDPIVDAYNPDIAAETAGGYWSNITLQTIEVYLLKLTSQVHWVNIFKYFKVPEGLCVTLFPLIGIKYDM